MKKMLDKHDVPWYNIFAVLKTAGHESANGSAFYHRAAACRGMGDT